MSSYNHYSIYIGRTFVDSQTSKRAALQLARQISLGQPQRKIEVVHVGADSCVNETIVFRGGAPEKQRNTMKTQTSLCKGRKTSLTGPWAIRPDGAETKRRYAFYPLARAAARRMLVARPEVERVAIHDRYGFVVAVWRTP